MKGNIIYVNQHNRWIPAGSTLGSREVAMWLDDDIKEVGCKILIRQIETFDPTAQKTNYVTSGNAHHVFSTGKQVLLLCEYDDDQAVLLSTEVCIEVLKAYCDVLKSLTKNRHRQPDTIDIEYFFEGKEALVKFAELGGVLKA